MGKSFFEKDEYTIDDLNGLMRDEIEESINLDYKASGSLSKEDKKKAEIGKDISAFANSDGGIIIYGIAEVDHKPVSFSYVDGNTYNKEWLENVIDGNIQQKVLDIRIYPIRVDNDIKKTVYIVKIPKSNNAPHINTDKKYYRRYNFKSVPMEEYEVRLLYGRKSIAEIAITTAGLVDKGISENKKGVLVYNKELSVNVKNISDSIETNCKLEVVFEGILFDGLGLKYDFNTNISHTITKEKGVIVSSYNRAPIFPDEEITLCVFTIQIECDEYEFFRENAVLKFRVFYSSGYAEAQIAFNSMGEA